MELEGLVRVIMMVLQELSVAASGGGGERGGGFRAGGAGANGQITLTYISVS